MVHTTCFFAPKQKHPFAPQDRDVGPNSRFERADVVFLRADVVLVHSDVALLCGADVVSLVVDVAVLDFLGVLGDRVMASCEPKATKVSDFAQFQKCEECIFGAWQQIELLNFGQFLLTLFWKQLLATQVLL